MKFSLNLFKMFSMPTAEEVAKIRKDDAARHLARQESPEEIKERQLADAERQYLMHIAAAEEHGAQAAMFKERVARLRDIPQSSTSVVPYRPHHISR